MNTIVQLILGLLLADLVTGLFHWVEDSYFDYCLDLPFLGGVAKHNEMHHYYPRSIVHYSPWENISTTIPFVAVFYIILYFAVDERGWTEYGPLIWSALLLTAFSNVFHRCCHMRPCENGAVVRGLQRCGIMVSNDHHRSHHVQTDSRYCVITEYSNHLWDGIGLWRGLEKVVEVVTGYKALPKPKYDDYKAIHTPMHDVVKKACPRVIDGKEMQQLKSLLKRHYSCPAR
jgi:hypothetical protein